MRVTEVRRSLTERRTEYYAMYVDQIKNLEDQVLYHGPCSSIAAMEALLKDEEPSSWLIVTKVKEVKVHE